MNHKEMMVAMKRMAMLQRIADTIRGLKVEVRSPADRAREKNEAQSELPITGVMPVHDVKMPKVILCDRMDSSAAEMLAIRLTEAFCNIAKEFERDVKTQFKSTIKEEDADE